MNQIDDDAIARAIHDSVARSTSGLDAPHALARRSLDRSIRLRRRRTTVGVGLVAVAAVAAIGAGSLAWPDPAERPPIGLPTAQSSTIQTSANPTPSVTSSTDDSTPTGDENAAARAWFEALPVGPAPTVPYLAGATLVDGDAQVAVAPGSTILGRASADVGGGWYVSSPDRLIRVTADGGSTEFAGPVAYAAVSPDASQVAIQDASDPETIRVVGGADGAEVTAFEVGAGATIAGWTASGVLLESESEGPADSSDVRLVALDGTARDVPDAFRADVLDAREDLVALLGYGCIAITVIATMETVGTECSGMTRWYSPDGRYGLGTVPTGTDEVPAVLGLVSSGAPDGEILLWDAPSAGADFVTAPTGPAWESPGSVLVRYRLEDELGARVEGVARCSVPEGTCEVALPMVPVDAAPWYRFAIR